MVPSLIVTVSKGRKTPSSYLAAIVIMFASQFKDTRIAKWSRPAQGQIFQAHQIPPPVSLPLHRLYFFFASLCFLMPSFRNLIAFFGPPVPLILNFFPRC